jgi:Tfp pilus assembly protein PilO
MKPNFTNRRKLILGCAVLLGTADLALAVYSWQLASGPKAPRELLAQQAKKLKALEQNIQNAQKIRDETPETQKQCDQFERSLFLASEGYSTLTAEIKSIGKKAGVQMEDLTLKQTAVEKRNLEEVSIEAAIAGDYKGVIEFLNGLQRAETLYVVDSLNLASQASGQGPSSAIKVSVHLKTFFRATP